MLVWALAAATPATTDSLPQWGQYGVLGLAVAGLAVFARQAYNREAARADRLEQENQRLNQLIQDKHIPALESSTTATREMTEYLRVLAREKRGTG